MGAVDDLVTEWADAERHGDVAALDTLLDDDFRGVGPAGFVLSKQQWLDRYRDRDLVNEAFTWSAIDVRTYDEVAVAVGIQEQTAAYRGHDASARLRGSLVAVHGADRWRIVHVQLGGLAGPPRG